MLEDEFTDVLRKALIGHGLGSAQLAGRSGLAEREVQQLLDGEFSPDALRRIAPVLELNPEALVSLPSYVPAPMGVDGVERLELPFHGGSVNAWLVRKGDAIALFDAGCDSGDLLREIETRCSRMPDRVFITHDHGDHTGALDQFIDGGIPTHGAGIPRTIPLVPGVTVRCGALLVRACDLSGHANPALGYHVEGLAVPVLVTGDALFAGSMGGCSSPAVYQHALRRLRDVLHPLPDETVLLPGHGPATTLGEERVSNPFL